MLSEMCTSIVYHKVARLHREYIDQGFLATLGPSFLALLYEAIDKDEGSVLIVKEVDGDVVGFVSGTTSLRPIYIKLLRRPFSLFLALVGVLLSVSKLLKVIEILLISKNNPVLTGLPRYELLTIVVDPLHQGQGYAEELFESLCGYFSAISVKTFKIIVGVDLARAHAFYLKMGCTVAGEIEVHKGKNSWVYVKHCS
ncbi:GNAT family N-acetyltransferase [Pseudomonadales bacterium]|nr:GNAT family N-acetyltransferase [Pseudomonadales bacterium]